MSNESDLEERMEALKAAYPYQFARLFNYGISIDAGWWPILQRACREVDDILAGASVRKENFSWHQVKEKFGGLRMYWGRRWIEPSVSEFNGTTTSFDRLVTLDFHAYVTDTDRAFVIDTLKHAMLLPDDVCEQIRDVVASAERAASQTCETCGDPGRMVKNVRGMLRTACKQHMPKDAIMASQEPNVGG